MRPARLRTGELLTGAGAGALTLLLFLDWFALDVPVRVTGTGGRIVGTGLHTSGWSSLGWLLVALLVGVLALAVWLVVATLRDAAVSEPVAAAVLATAAAATALIALAVRVAIAQPGLGANVPDRLVSVRPAAYLGLAAVALILAGAWRSMADERTDAPESAYAPPPARRAPPAPS